MFVTLVTALGQSKLAAHVLAGTQMIFAHVAVGDVGTAPDGTETALRNEVERVEVNLVEADPVLDNRVNIEAIIPVTSGGYWIREFGVFDADGDLVVIGQYPDTYKPTEAEGTTRAQVIRTALVISRIEVITLTTDLTTVLGTRDYIDAHQNRRDNPHEVTPAQLIPGGTVNQALFKQSNEDGDVEWRDITAVAVIVDAQQEVQFLAADQTTVTLSGVTTTGLAVYVGGARLIPGADYNETSSTEIELDRSYPAGTPIMLVNNDPYGEVEATTTTIGLMRRGTPESVYKTGNPTIGWVATSPEDLPMLLPAWAPNRLWKMGVNGPNRPAFAAVLGAGGSVVTVQNLIFGVGTNATNAQSLFVAANTAVNLAAVVAPGSYTIWWDGEEGEFQAHDISWDAIEAGTRPNGTAHGPLGGFEVGGKPGDIDILPHSCWDTMWRPAARDPRGMVLVNGSFWADVYFTHDAQWNKSLPSSVYEQNIADGDLFLPTLWGEDDPVQNYGNCSWYTAHHVLMNYGKRPPTYAEFCVLAAGSGVGREATRPAETGYIAGRRSLWGVEQAAGCVPVWGGAPVAYYTGEDNDFTVGSDSRSSMQGRWIADIEPAFQAFGGGAEAGGTAGTYGGAAHVQHFVPSALPDYVGIRGICDHVITR